MKKLIILFAATTLSLAVNAQEVKKDVKKAANATEREAKKVGNKTAEVATKAESKIVDEEVKDKMGPGGQKVYRRSTKKGDQYYYVDSKGHKRGINKMSLKDK